MFAGRQESKTLLAVMLVIAVVAVAIPTCEMIGCDMAMCGGMMRIATHPGPTVAPPCGGTWVFNSSQAGVVPVEFLSLLVALVGALAVMAFFFSPMAASRLLFIAEANAPPPPIEPRGERYRL